MRAIVIIAMIAALTTPARTATAPAGRCLSGDCVNGYGTYRWPDNSVYAGQWKKGKRQGHGTLTWPNGSRHTGLWRDDVQEGAGIYVSFYGITYRGSWKGSYVNGPGSITYPDGTRYVGSLVDGKRQGVGTLYDRSGAVIKKGIWKDDEFTGSGS